MTGSSLGIGAAIGKRPARHGGKIVLHGRSESPQLLVCNARGGDGDILAHAREAG